MTLSSVITWTPQTSDITCIEVQFQRSEITIVHPKLKKVTFTILCPPVKEFAIVPAQNT